MVLDPHHFGIGSTITTTFAVGTPIVTMPGRHLCGRAGLAYCTLLGLDECIAVDQADYVKRAVTIASDRTFRAELQARILKNNWRLLDSKKGTHQIRELLISLYDSHINYAGQ